MAPLQERAFAARKYTVVVWVGPDDLQSLVGMHISRNPENLVDAVADALAAPVERVEENTRFAAATGKRIRTLPLAKRGYRWA